MKYDMRSFDWGFAAGYAAAFAVVFLILFTTALIMDHPFKYMCVIMFIISTAFAWLVVKGKVIKDFARKERR